MEKVKENKHKIMLISLIVLLILFFIAFIYSIYYSYKLVSKYNNIMYPNVYINNYNISKININKLDLTIGKIENDFQSKQVILKSNTKSYQYTLKDLGVGIDKVKLKKEIVKYHNNLSYSRKILQITGKKKKIFYYNIYYKDIDLNNFVTKLKTTVDSSSSDGKLVMDGNRNLHYQEATSSFYLDTNSTTTNIKNYIKSKFKDESISLVGSSTVATDSVSLKTIDTKISTYSTKYNAFISRGKNLETALNYIDGVIVNPGEVFSYFKYAGPYDKSGYVWYDKAIGNGVCQIASTIYNTALLGGLEIVERHQHGWLLTYVPGGQDATVVSNGNTNSLDFKFKNIYSYPIYISAYYGNGLATVDFWSNSNATGGKTYTVESVQTAYKTYETYLHTWINGVDTGKTFIAKTHYYKESS